VLENASAHLISLDSFKGLSTRPKQGTANDYAVSYKQIALLENVDWINEIGESINITRAYTNPMNGEQSLAFCNRVTLYDPESESSEAAVLLRVIPISTLEQKWVFPQTELVNAELSMIDANGDYILKGYSFKNSSFFEFTGRNVSLPSHRSRPRPVGRYWVSCRRRISMWIRKTGCWSELFLPVFWSFSCLTCITCFI
jgi:hypothetical protein